MTNPDLIETPIEAQHFKRAVAQLGESSPVIASKAIFNAKGVKIIEKGVAINLGLYERLMQHQLSVPIEESVTSANAVNGKMLRMAAEQAIRETPLFSRIAMDSKAGATLLDAIEKIPLPDPIAFQLTLARDIRPNIYLHSIWMAITAGWLALEPLGSRFDISMAAAAGLLHDIGMLHLEPVLLQSWQLLSQQKQRQLYVHPLVSKTLIERHHAYTKDVVRAVLEHHEFLDGSGYPHHLVGKAISNLGQILSLAEVVSAMLAPGRDASELRVSVILRMNSDRFSPALVRRVLPLLKFEDDAPSVSTALLSDSVRRLNRLNLVIAAWPANMVQLAGLSETRRKGLTQSATQASKLTRSLVCAGAAPEQLALLDISEPDHRLDQELSLLAGEVTWQLRALARQTIRQWNIGPGEVYPDDLQNWLDQVSSFVESDPTNL